MSIESYIKSYMFKPGSLLFFSFSLLFWSCKNDSKYKYAIKDFREPLHPYLTKIVSNGIVMNYDSSLRNMTNDNELIKLSQSEHPILRASAFREIRHRNSINHFDILMSHLDDTATVATDAGEFGIWFRTVSDDILLEAEWKTEDEKNKTIQEVLTKHNYLSSAYFILRQIEPQEKYYTIIKAMASQPKRLSDEGYELDFGEAEYALYGLSKFKKKDDVKIIKNRMMKNIWRLSYISFELMKEFPDTAYFDVLLRYHWKQFYKFSGNRREGFSGFPHDKADPEDFIQALVAQQSDKGAQLLDTMLHRLPLQTCLPQRKDIMAYLVTEIWEHQCPAYTRLLEKIKPKVVENSKWDIIIPRDSLYKAPPDTTKEIIRWYQ